MTPSIQETTVNDLMAPSGDFWGILQLGKPPVYMGSLSDLVNAAMFRPRGTAPRGAIMRKIFEPGG